MRAKTRRADRKNERRNRRNENDDSRITKGSEHHRSLPNKLGAINKEKGLKEILQNTRANIIITIAKNVDL